MAQTGIVPILDLSSVWELVAYVQASRELKASGPTESVSNSQIKGSWRQACGGAPQAQASGEIDSYGYT